MNLSLEMKFEVTNIQFTSGNTNQKDILDITSIKNDTEIVTSLTVIKIL